MKHFGLNFFLLFIIVIFIIQIFVDITPQLAFSPIKIAHGELWRFVSSMFLHSNALHLLMNLLCFIQVGISLEAKVGTLSFIYHILLLEILGSLVHFLLALIIESFGYEKIFITNSIGFSGVLFSLIVIDIHLEGGEYRSFFGLFLIPSIYYPWILLVIMIPFEFFNIKISFLGHLSGLMIGYLYSLGILKFLVPSDPVFQWIERKLCCCFSERRFGYINVGGDESFVYHPYTVFQHNWADDEDVHQQNHQVFVGTPRTIGETANQNNEQIEVPLINNEEQEDENLKSLNIAAQKANE